LKWAMVLAQASIMGVAAACRSYRVSERSVSYWRRAVRTDEAFRELFEQKRRECDESWAVSERERLLPPAGPPAADSTRALALAITASVSSVAAHCGLPPVAAVVRPRQLPREQCPDLLLAHGAAGYTACLVLKHRAERRHECEQRVVGRLLFMLEDVRVMSPEDRRLAYLENIRLLCRVAPSYVRLIVLGDYDPGPIFHRALARFGASFFDVSACLAGQNVLAMSEVAAA
jgi:hypothetical protein